MILHRYIAPEVRMTDTLNQFVFIEINLTLSNHTKAINMLANFLRTHVSAVPYFPPKSLAFHFNFKKLRISNPMSMGSDFI